MKKTNALLIPVFLVFAGCNRNDKKTGQPEPGFPVISYIQSQVAHVDTSLYSILKIIYRDSLHADTTYLRREDFKEAAKDFLQLTDITQKKYKDRYKEEKLYDETMNRVILRYSPINPEKEDIQKQEILIAPDPSGDKVTSIFIDQVINNRDSSVQKLLLWRVNKSFTVTVILQKTGQPELTTVTKVAWNDESEE
jgi:hypothetical protein